MAHARRYFKEAEDNDKARSVYALQKIQEIYEIERRVKELSIEHRYLVRQEEVVPILEDLQKWMIEQYKSVTPKSPIGKVLEYSIPNRTVNNLEDLLPTNK